MQNNRELIEGFILFCKDIVLNINNTQYLLI